MNATPSYGPLLLDLQTHFPELKTSVDLGRAADLNRNVREFAHRHSLTDAETREHISRTLCEGAFFLAAYPGASQKNLQLAVDIIMWYILFDDVHVERAGSDTVDSLNRNLFELLDVAGGNTMHPSPGFSVALAEILHRAEGWSGCQQHALRSALCGVLLGWQWEAQLRAMRSQPSLQTYLNARLHAGGGRLERAYAEPIGGYVLPAAARRDPHLIRLNHATSNLLVWVNDLCSYEKEKKQEGNHLITLPHVLIHEKGCTLTDAITHSCEMISREANEAAEVIDYLSRSPIPEVRAYARDTRHMLRVQTAFYAKGGLGRYADS
ncbi:hypothetical protein ACFV98_30290 [Streptomyces violascens]|uniref:terpene synthase family protein n=1 Tax=Streptomyces violascens TaxID=67381 RepID=UPI003646D11A